MKLAVFTLIAVMLVAAVPAGAAEPTTQERADQVVKAVPTQGMFLLPAADLKKALDTKDMTVAVIDIRPAAMYAKGHIAGSQNIPLPTLVQDMQKVPKGKKIAVVCGMDTNSAIAVTVLRMFGYDAWIVQGGVPGWEKAGYPLVKETTTTATKDAQTCNMCDATAPGPEHTCTTCARSCAK